MQFSLEQIREFAPDEKSVAAAKQLQSPRLWQAPGVSEDALWGICGGGRNYQVRIDLSDMGFNCNCPSRKFPCKHVLALLMLFASVPDLFSFGMPPDWVNDWIEKRRSKKQKQLEQKSAAKKPVDKAAQANRVLNREANIADGIGQLIVWMDDIIRNGVAALESKPYSFWDSQARRLVDSQAKGLASRIRALSEIPGSSRDWPQRVLTELGRTRLLVHAYERLDKLTPALQADVRQFIGWTISQDELNDNDDFVEDDWFIFGQTIQEDDRFRSQRSWAIGLKSQREALLLQFAHGQQGFPEAIIPGKTQKGKLQFYPGAIPQRAKFVERSEGEHQLIPTEIPNLTSLADFLQSYADRLALNPWLATCSCLVNNVTMTMHQKKWYIRDEVGHGLELRIQNPFELLAVTGGAPFQIFGEWNGHRLTPLSYLFQEQWQRC